eukprot:CFRG7117T1
MGKDDYVCDGDVCTLKAKGADETISSTSCRLPTFNKDSLIDCQGNTVDSKILDGKIVGLYFSAGWCGPCRVFSPKLAEFEKKYKEDFVVLFVSLDKSEKVMMDYVNGKSFICIRYGDQLRTELPSTFTVTMLPTLAVISHENRLLTTWGRSAIDKNEANCLTEWKNGQAGVSWMQLLKFW